MSLNFGKAQSVEDVLLCEVLVNNSLVIYHKRRIIYKINEQGTYHGGGLKETFSVSSLDQENCQTNHKISYAVTKHGE